MRIILIVFLGLFLKEHMYSQNYNYKETGLPVCYITTKDSCSIDSKEYYIPAKIKIIHCDRLLLSDSDIEIRIRGNATSNYPKKPYKIRFSKRTSPLPGINKDRSFVLLSNYTDRSLINTAIGLKIGSMLDNGWVPYSEFVEVVINGEFQGNYQFAEDVKLGKSRVEVAENGFFIEFDFNYKNSLHYFATDYNNWYFTFKYPEDEDMIEENFNYAQEYMNRFETYLYSNDFNKTRSYTQFIDEESFTKWYYQKNLLQMDECNRYYLKYDNSEENKLKMGPIWDFEWCLANAGYRMLPEHYLENKLYFEQISKDDTFMRNVALIHAKYGEKIYSEIISFYDVLADSLKKSQEENFKRWDILDIPISLSTTPLGSWEKEIEYSKKFFIEHYKWLDDILSEYNTSVNGIKEDDIETFPNIYDIYGQRINGIPDTHGIYIMDGKKYTLPALLKYINISLNK